MLQKNSHCTYCGAEFPPKQGWPRKCSHCGTTSYLNPIPVVVVLVPIDDGVIVIRRNIEPQKGTLTLPGGYLDIGETWQEGARRELFEETGIAVPSEEIRLYDVMNGLDNTLVIFGLATRQNRSAYKPFNSSETQEVVLIREPIELGFTMHTRVVQRFFEESRYPLASP